MMKNNREEDKQFALFAGKYITGRIPDKKQIERFLQAVEIKRIFIDKRDQAVWNFLIRHPWSIALLDAGLAITYRNNPIRQKLIVLTAILEATPEHCRAFMPASYRFWEKAGLFFLIIRAALYAAFGYIIIKALYARGPNA